MQLQMFFLEHAMHPSFMKHTEGTATGDTFVYYVRTDL